jgi:hypothetical protein
MAEDQVGLRRDEPRPLPLWTKLFSGFKVALDPKKLLLAAAGILVMWFGWYVLSVARYATSSKPNWSDYKEQASSDRDAAFRSFKQAHNHWKLAYEMAAPLPSSPDKAEPFDAADKADSAAEYELIQDKQTKYEKEISKRTQRVKLERGDATRSWLLVEAVKIPFGVENDKELETLAADLRSNPLTAEKLMEAYDGTPQKEDGKKAVRLRNITLVNIDPKAWEAFEKDLRSSRQLSDIKRQVVEELREKRATDDGERRDLQAALKAIELIEMKAAQRYLPVGQIRTWPGWEYRGPNPYLLATGQVHTRISDRSSEAPWAGGAFLPWFAGVEVPVLLEPLVKFLRPVIYLLHPEAGFWNRIYLTLAIVWTLATWAVFGGAITRMAAVQVARNNEKIGLTDAVRFAWSRFQSFLSAPLLPLAFVLILTVLLFVFGLIVAWTFFLGDILVVGLGFPLALILGLIMAVVLVGLVGWPLMYATISTEGSDSFDAISRSYSYVYQAPWHYLWYGIVALAYGAALLFFVGLMGSLVVYVTKWGANLAPTLEKRDPAYLYTYAPKSFGWRDLLLYQSPHATAVPEVRTDGTLTEALKVRFDENTYSFSPTNWIAAILVALWLYLLFFLVLGFGFSYFWTASTIIYLLMRRKVDDTDLDEIHLEEETEEPFVPPSTAGSTAPSPAKTGTTPLSVVDAPALRNPPPAAPPATSEAVTTPIRGPEPPAGTDNTSPAGTVPPPSPHGPAEGETGHGA